MMAKVFALYLSLFMFSSALYAEKLNLPLTIKILRLYKGKDPRVDKVPVADVLTEPSHYRTSLRFEVSGWGNDFYIEDLKSEDAKMLRDGIVDGLIKRLNVSEDTYHPH